MVEINYSTAPHSSLVSVALTLKSCKDYLNKLEQHFHKVASEVTADFSNTFEQDLHSIFKAIQDSKYICEKLTKKCSVDSPLSLSWHSARKNLYSKISCIQGYAEIILENMHDFSYSFIYDLQVIIKITGHLRPLIEQIKSTDLALKEEAVLSNNYSYPACFIGGNLKPFTVVLIDDDEGRCALYKRRFVYSNYKLFSAVSFENVLQLSHQYQIDAVILSINSENYNSEDILFKLKYNHRTSQIPVIVIGTQDEIEDITYYIMLGADDYIQLPITLTLFQLRVKKTLYKNNLLKQIKQL